MKLLFSAAMLFATSIGALAADDMPALRPAYGTEPQKQSFGHNPWNGPYIGLFGGVASSSYAYTTSADDEFNVSGGGLLGGVRAGFDYSVGGAVFGAVADYAISSNSASMELAIPGVGTGELGSTLTSLATLRGRIGFNAEGTMFYVHGGGAVGTTDLTYNDDEIDGVIDNPRFGYVAGVGMEHSFTGGATFTTEYRYVDLGKADIYSSGGHTISENLPFHSLTTGVNIGF